MSRTNRNRLRWGVPAVVALTVAGAVLATNAYATPAPTGLAPRTAAELLADLATPTTDALSGTVIETANLGLPELPGAAGNALGPLTLASGSHTLRVWTDGPSKTRVAVQGRLAEYDVVRSGHDVWTWTNKTAEVSHLVLPAHQSPQSIPLGLAGTPAEVAAAALAAVDPSTAVTVDRSVAVAGRSARQLVLAPKATGSLVASVRIAVDAATNVPLRVQIFSVADSANPALDVGFSDISFGHPDAATFAFTPPAGSTVKTLTPAAPAVRGVGEVSSNRPTVIGKGWTAVVEKSGVDIAAFTANQPKLLDQLSTRVAKGRVLSTALVSVLLTDDGRLLIGAVPVAALEAAA